jgi:hypothetical protein
MMKMHRTAPAQLELTFSSSMDVRVNRLPNGEVHLKPGKITVSGTVRDACRVLGGCCPQVIYALIREGEIIAKKPKPNAPNSKYRVDMTTVYALDERQRLAARDI